MHRTLWTWSGALVCALAVLSGCGDDSSGSDVSGAADAGADVAVQDDAGGGGGGGDVGADLGPDVSDDAGPTDAAEGDDTGTDAGDDAAAQDDAGGDAPPDDVGEDASDGDAGDGDAGDPPKSCMQVAASPDWALEGETDVSIAYRSVVEPRVQGYPLLTLLFERYAPGPDVGVFDLGVGADGDYGTCAHCVVMQGSNIERAFFADRGTLEMFEDPYSRRLGARMRGLRLVEVEVDPFTRSSTPIPGGDCIEIADFEAAGNFPRQGWTCDEAQYNDGARCDCTCGAWDPDCNPGQTECPPGVPDCELRETLPIADCDAAQLCTFDPETFAGACTDVCDWARRADACTGDLAVCVYDIGVGDGPTCWNSVERVSPAMLGEPCSDDTIYQQVCNVVDGFAEGYCGPAGVCRPLCQTDAECPVEGETCRHFMWEGDLGYCGPEPVDLDD